MIVFQNGKKAFPEEYEFLLNRIDGVKDSFAWGHRESDGDVRMCAKLVTDNPGPELADYIEKEIKKLNNNIPQYKMLRYFILSEKPIIRSTTLKIKRGEEQKRIDGYLSENGLTMRAANKTVINC